MKKIFKYKYDPTTKTAIMPLEARILRVDHVDDGFYKGDFVWAIVNVGDENVERKVETPHKRWIGTHLEPYELRVKEKQRLKTFGPPVAAGEEDGKIYVYCEDRNICEEHRIIVYKTGQEILEPVEKLTYVGLCRLWIVQELGLFVFRLIP